MATLRWLLIALFVSASAQSLAQSNMPSSGKTGSESSNAKAGSDTEEGQPVLTEAQTLVKLHQANLMEMEAGGMAASRARSGKVRQYGEQLIKDHRQADNTVQAFAKRKGVDLDSAENAPPEPAGQARSGMDALRDLSGTEFDRGFLTAMVNDHDDTIRMVRNARSQTQDPEFRALLNKLLPVLQQHRDLAQRLLRTTGQMPA
jgi:putative membrane protein